MSGNPQRAPIVEVLDPAPRAFVMAEDAIQRRRLLAALGGLGSSSGAANVAVVSGRDVRDGLTALAGLRDSAQQDLRTVLVVPAASAADVREAFAAGADGLVLESTLEIALAPALAAVLSDQLVFPRTRRTHLAPPALSVREKQVLGLVVLGFSNQEVAAKLHVTEATVKSHLTASFRKLGVRSRAEASARILDPHDGLGLGILSIADPDVALDVFGDS
ncbi:MAG: LuxR C-terminal-related transcriptional regulator [Gaiellaceae bacterium MAG52_C11]|nr:LuxR C-terminal-related transcriptional regulator [Candidatus Gaiellasilicea maunaloa]